MDQIEWTLLAIGLGISLSALVIWRLQRYRKSSAYHQKQNFAHRLLRSEEKLVTHIHKRFSSWLQTDQQKQIDLISVLEILLIGLWAFWVSREYLNFDPGVIPSGREFNSAIQTHHLWTRFAECGWCALWNGTERGGHPALVDMHGSMLHPLVVISTSLWGVLNGAKLTLVLSFWTAGIAQWWIAQELKVGRLARLWSSGMAVVGGHLAGRMELGVFGVVLSTAMTSLIFGGILAVANKKGRRAGVLLGIVTASALLAGQGYIQVGLVSITPAFVFLLLDEHWKIKETWKDYFLALTIALLLAAVFLVPMLHFFPNFDKYMDPEFKVAQPLKFIPLNYVIDSFEYYTSTALDKYPFPHLYTLFIGWIPIGLAVYGLSNTEKLPPSTRWFMISSMVLILVFSSGDALKFIAKFWKGAAGIRHPSQIAGLTIPIILGLSALGLDKLFHENWPKFWLSFGEDENQKTRFFPTQWLLIIPLIISLRQGYQFSQMWIHTQDLNPEINQVIDALKTESLEWVQTPFGEHLYIEPAVRRGYKLSPGIMTWRWKSRDFPLAHLEASHSGPPQDASKVIKYVNQVAIYQRPKVHYASITNGSHETPCRAYGTGGKLSVRCDSDHGGNLVLKEYTWSGWKAWRNDQRVRLIGKTWLTVEAPPGNHTYTFRYQPWDVPLGLFLSGVGILVAGGVWIYSTPPGKRIQTEEETG